MKFTDNPFERLMKQRPGTDSSHPCRNCRYRKECGYLLHSCRKKFRPVLDVGAASSPCARRF